MSEIDVSDVVSKYGEDTVMDVLRRSGLARLEDKSPAGAVDAYLDERDRTGPESTVRTYKTRLQGFVDWCDDKNIDTMVDVDSKILHDFYQYRQQRDLSDESLRSYQQALKKFLEYCGQQERWTRRHLCNDVKIPEPSNRKTSDNKTLDHSTAKEIVEHLGRFDACSREHLVMTLFSDTGMRIGTLHSLDVDDYNSNTSELKLRHRPDEGTRLKNGYESNRIIIISEYAGDVIEDYIYHNPFSVTDEYGRSPLLTSKQGRLSKPTIRNYVNRITQPCLRTTTCPSDRELSDCSPRGVNEIASKCPHSMSPHAIRRGYITKMKELGIDQERREYRCDVSGSVEDEHYEGRSMSEIAKQNYYGKPGEEWGMSQQRNPPLPPCADPDKDRLKQNKD